MNIGETLYKLYMQKVKNEIAKLGKRPSDEKIDELLSTLYESFGSQPLDVLGGKSPKAYYSEMDCGALKAELESCVLSGGEVSDYLLDECEKRFSLEQIGEYITPQTEEGLIMHAINFLGGKDYRPLAERLFDLIMSPVPDEHVKEIACEMLTDIADDTQRRAVELYEKQDVSDEAKGYLLEIMVHGKLYNRVFEILKREFVENEDTALIAAYFGEYGDERALPILLERVKNDDLNYHEHREIVFAIETLGGEYNDDRDYSNDSYYKKLKDN